MIYLAKKTADYLKKNGVISEELYEAYIYGIQIGIEMCLCFSVCLCISIYLHMVIEFLLSHILLILLRSYAGGMHLHSFKACFICSVIVQYIILIINEHYRIFLPLSWFMIGIGIFFMWKVAPVESLNRQLNLEERKQCRKILKKILSGILIFSIGATLMKKSGLLSLAALTLCSVTLSQYIGLVKCKYESKRRR